MIHFNDEVSRFKGDRNIHSKYTSTARFGNLQVAHSRRYGYKTPMPNT